MDFRVFYDNKTFCSLEFLFPCFARVNCFGCVYRDAQRMMMVFFFSSPCFRNTSRRQHWIDFL